MRCRSASLGFTTSLAVPTTRVRKTPRCRSCRIIAAQQWQILARPCCRVSVAEGGQLRQGIAMIYRFYSFVPSKSMSTLVRLGWCFDLARIVALRPILAGDEVTVLPAQRERERSLLSFRFVAWDTINNFFPYPCSNFEPRSYLSELELLEVGSVRRSGFGVPGLFRKSLQMWLAKAGHFLSARAGRCWRQLGTSAVPVQGKIQCNCSCSRYTSNQVSMFLQTCKKPK